MDDEQDELIRKVTLADKLIHLARSRSKSFPLFFFILLKRNKTTATAELMCSCFCGFRVQSSETEFDAHTPEFPSLLFPFYFLMAPIKFSADRERKPNYKRELFFFLLGSQSPPFCLCPSGNNSPEWA
jgi:hypothetical protein